MALILLAYTKIVQVIGEGQASRAASAENSAALSSYEGLESGEDRLSKLQGLERELYKKQLAVQKNKFIKDHGETFGGWVESSDDDSSENKGFNAPAKSLSVEVPYHSAGTFGGGSGSNDFGAYIDADSPDSREKEIPF